MKANTIVLGIVALIFLLACRKQTAEDKTSRSAISAQTHEIEPEDSRQESDSVSVLPVEHASFVMELNGRTIYVDPVGQPEDYRKFRKPDLILVTDVHSDHFLPEVLAQLIGEKTILVMPRAVYAQALDTLQKQGKILDNGEKLNFSEIQITAIPMYNLREEAKDFHPKGRGNGYLLEAAGKRIYISGDTEDIPEMRKLKDIDLAFVCMNMPYTMTIDQAVDAVLEFKPKKVYPYHYRGTEGFSDVERFKEEIEEKNPDIKVQLLDWYDEL